MNIGVIEVVLMGFVFLLIGCLVLIVGGDVKGVDLFELKLLFDEYVDVVIVLGWDGKVFSDIVENGYYVVILFDVVSLVVLLIQLGDIVLLLFVCVSFDMFKNYQYWVEVFVSVIGELLV